MMTDKKPAQLTFAEFAEAIRPTGAVNRFPAVGAAADMYTYSVYMNGPMAAALPRHAREHTYKDVTLQALVEKVQLNPLNARDNLKVAELVSLRGAWMSAVLETTIGQGPSAAEILADYAVLSEGMGHPWIASELAKQRELSAKLGPTLARAGLSKDVVPREVSVGMVVGQDADFTLQRTQDGEVVTHENRRLQALPAVGEAVMVSYYRGAGQVVESLDKVKFSDPYVDADSEDLAVRVTSEGVAAAQLVLFNSVQSYDLFVKAHGLDERLVQRAFDVRAARPKSDFRTPPREPVKLPYVDDRSGCLALDYVERGMQEDHTPTYTALFESAQAMASLAAEYGLGAKAIAEAHRLEHEMVKARGEPLQRLASDRALRESEIDIRRAVEGHGYAFPDKSGGQDRDYMGPIVAVSGLHVAQDVGRRQTVIHDIRTLDKAPQLGDRLNVKFKDGRGLVTDLVRAGKDLGR